PQLDAVHRRVAVERRDADGDPGDEAVVGADVVPRARAAATAAARDVAGRLDVVAARVRGVAHDAAAVDRGDRVDRVALHALRTGHHLPVGAHRLEVAVGRGRL